MSDDGNSADSASAIGCVRHTLIATALVTMMAMTSYPAHGDASTAETDRSMFSFNGFGTLGVVHSNEDKADFVGGFFQPNGAGFTHHWSPGVDSKFGLQLDARFSDRLSAVVQVASQHQYDNSYRPAVEWANLKYQFTPDVSIRVGRTVSSFFMVSESGLVGYANPWVRPPLEVYGLLPINHVDGIDATYRVHPGEFTNTLLASYGRFTSKTTGNGEASATQLFTISDTLEYGAISVRFGYFYSRINLQTPSLDALFGGFTQFGAVLSVIPGLQALGARAASLADQYRVSNVPYSIKTVGGSYDPGNWLLMGEWGRVNTSAFISDETAGYITGGYRIGTFTPFLTLARLQADKLSAAGIPTTGLPPVLAGTAGALNSGLQAVLNEFSWTQSDVAAGVRWDVRGNVAIKLQFDHLMLGAGSNGRLINVQPGFQTGSNINLFSATVDFVF